MPKGKFHCLVIFALQEFQWGVPKKRELFDVVGRRTLFAQRKNNNIKNEHIYKLIEHYGIKAAKKKSLFQSKIRYESGTLVPNGEDLLLAFAKLDKDGLGYMSYDEFIDCLRLLWKEINKYYGENDVYIPILGSGVTRMGNESLTQQKLLDIIIKSYSLSQYKLKLPCKLHIICKEREGFSLNEIEDY